MPARRMSSSSSTAYPPVDSAEHRPGDGRRQRLAHRIGEVGRAAVQRRGQRRDGRAQADGGGGSGIDAGQQRVDGACHDLLAEPVASPRSATAGSSAAQAKGRVRSSTMREIVASSTSPASDDAWAGMPLRVSRGN